MKLLIIGDAVSQYTTNFSTVLKKLRSDIFIDIINIHPISNKQLTQTVKGIYRHVFNDQPLLGLIEKIPKLRGLIRFFYSKGVQKKVRRNINSYDVILLHGLGIRNCEIFRQIDVKKKFSVCAIWGSDFYKRGKSEHIIFRTMDICDRVNISTDDMIRDVLRVKNIPADKIRRCLFGLAPLEILFQNPQLNRKEAKRFLGLNENDFIITVGYNGTANQQHLKIIKAVAKIKNQLPVNYKLVLQMTYGAKDESYQKQVRDLLFKYKFEHIIYKDFMTDEAVAHLRKATDIFIQTQVTDAFSGSMQEHLFAQSIVITGEWLPYQFLKDKGVYYETIDSMKSLAEKLSDVLNDYEKINEIIKLRNTPEKFKASLWSECIKDWYEVLNEYKNYNK
jgi:hypothetical protein